MPTPPTSLLPLFTRSWIGLDAGPVPRAAIARIVLGRPRIRTWHGTAIPAGLRRRLARGVRCCAALPAQAGLVVPLNPPALPAAKRRRILPALLDLQLPFPSEQCACAFAETPMQTVGLAVRHEDLRAALEALALQQLDPERLVPLGWVLWTQALREHPAKDPSEPRAVLWTSDDRWVAVTGRGGLYGSVASVAAGNAEALRRALQMALGGAARSLRAVCAGPNAESMAGELAHWPEPWRVESCAVASPESFLARALATDALCDRRGDTQLRQPPLAHPWRNAELPRTVRAATTAALASAVLLLVSSLATRHLVAQQEAAASQRLAMHLEQVAGYPVRTKGARAVQEARDALAERLDPNVERLRSPQTSKDLQRVLQAAKGAGVSLTHLALAPDGPTLSGRAPSTEAADTFATRLREAGQRGRLEADPEPTDDGHVAFLMTPEATR